MSLLLRPTIARCARAVAAKSSITATTVPISGRIIACVLGLCATALAGCAIAPEPRPTTERPESEFVYETLGATPSIQFAAPAAKKAESGPTDRRSRSTDRDANAPSG